MAYSSGTRSFMGEIAGWAVVGLAGVYSIIHFDELKTMTAGVLGLPTPAEMAAADGAQAVSADGESEAVPSGGTVELKAEANGHFHTEAEVNGRGIEVMVDTGATLVALTYEDAERAGIYLNDSDFTHRVSTANGIARVAPITIGKISIEGITVRNVDGAVCERGKLSTTLLGMSFLGRLDKFEMRQGVLVMED